MVPYVRMSFYKHFLDGLKYVEGMTDEEIEKFKKDLENTDISESSLDK